jgi:hypothetical protein
MHHLTLNPLTPNTPYLAHSFTELRDLCGAGSSRCKAENVLRALESEEQCVRTRMSS